MKSRVALSLLVGVVVTGLLLVGASRAESAEVARTLFWHNSVLQALAPCAPLDLGEGGGCEGTSLHLFVFALSIPLGVLLYGGATYVIIGFWTSRRNAVRG